MSNFQDVTNKNTIADIGIGEVIPFTAIIVDGDLSFGEIIRIPYRVNELINHNEIMDGFAPTHRGPYPDGRIYEVAPGHNMMTLVSFERVSDGWKRIE